MILRDHDEYSAITPDERRVVNIAIRAATQCKETNGWWPRWVVVPRRFWMFECCQFDIKDILRITPSPVATDKVLCLRELPKLPELRLPAPELELPASELTMPFFRPWIRR